MKIESETFWEGYTIFFSSDASFSPSSIYEENGDLENDPSYFTAIQGNRVTFYTYTYVGTY